MTRATDLEAAILADPSADEPRLVYGDWLQAEGDPRGELVTLQAERRRRPDDLMLFEAEVALVDRLRAHLFGDAAPHLARVHVEWHLGFVERLHVREDGDPDLLEELLDELLARPVMRCLRHLALGCDTSDGARVATAVLAKRLASLPLLESLALVDEPPILAVEHDLAPL